MEFEKSEVNLAFMRFAIIVKIKEKICFREVRLMSF